MNKLTFWIVVCAATCGCAVDASPWARGSVSDGKSPLSIYSIKNSIPIGTGVDAAQSLLISEGFTCKFHENATLHFEEQNADGSVVKGTMENVDYLGCTRKSRDGVVICVDVVDVVFTAEGVSDVKVFQSLTGW